MSDTLGTVKRVFIGRPRASGEMKHQLLPKWMALPVFSSDPLSSVAYATEEMMLVLALAGGLGLYDRWILPLAAGVALLLLIVVTSYRQTVRAYPHGGGAYIVARENLGDIPGLTAASALLIDYTLTVSVSIAAGVAAVVSAVPAVAPHRLTIALAFVALVSLANLRGVREAGAIFALPTYLFVGTMFTLIGVGLVRCVSGCPVVPAEPGLEAPAQALTLVLLLRAFSSGATALTGVEAISNGVSAFRYPQSRNAAATLSVMGGMAVAMFLGISYLATRVDAVASEGMTRTVTAQIAQAVFGGGIGFYAVQVTTAAILVLAANTAYADFPRLSSVLARDRFLPRQLLARGDRLVFSNGILVLAVLSSLLLVAFDASVSRLIQLYVVGVFTSFTLSQWGMVRHWLRVRERGWQRSSVINGVGGTVTGVVLVVVTMTKFTHGAWIVVVAIPLLVALMRRIHNHYAAVSAELRAGIAEPEPVRRNHVVILLDLVDEPLARAISYARAVAPASIRALGVPASGVEVREGFADLAPDVPLTVLDYRPGHPVEALRTVLGAEPDRHPGDFTSVLIPETMSRSWLDLARYHRVALRLKSGLLAQEGVVVTNVVSPEGGPGPYTVEEPREHHVVVLVSAVHKATMRALAYAQGLQATSVRALSINLDVTGGAHLLQQWSDWGCEVPLELVDSPFRSLSDAVRGYVREFGADGRQRVVTCVLPEFVMPHWWQRPLHNQTALLIKGTLLFERGVVVTAVPYHLDLGSGRAGRRRG